jgi:maltooligosyltrehalose trehalohydrolase
LDGQSELFPDPASRFQPEGPFGPSEVIDPLAFGWSDADWKGIERAGQVIYEMHVGTFTQEGTWAAALAELPQLAALGVTVLEVMPVADFAGQFGWGYDGVNFFAPTRLYGRPDDFRRFVDRAHAVGLGVILDVVYNHFGPEGNFLREFASDYFSDRRETDWGPALNYDGENSRPVREFMVANARHWIAEYHLDGLRLDATQNIYDDSPVHLIAEVTQAVRDAAAGRGTLVVAENEPQEARLIRPRESGGYGVDAAWNDDYHHSVMVALTGKREAYYTDYSGGPQEIISAAKRGYLFQGQRYAWQKKRRGQPALGADPSAFVVFLQNHDQVANSGRGHRAHLLASPGKYRALTALTLLAPGTPLLFQGQEFASSAPFLYFADHEADLARRVFRGRNEFLAQFPSLASPEAQRELRDPAAVSTFRACKLRFAERTAHREAYALHCDLLELRRADPVFRIPRAGGVDGAVLSHAAFVLRFFGREAGDRILVVNLGAEIDVGSIGEPLLASPSGEPWKPYWSSEDVRYGGDGVASFETDEGIHIPSECAMVLTGQPRALVRDASGARKAHG